MIEVSNLIIPEPHGLEIVLVNAGQVTARRAPERWTQPRSKTYDDDQAAPPGRCPQSSRRDFRIDQAGRGAAVGRPACIESLARHGPPSRVPRGQLAAIARDHAGRKPAIA